jgi:hypothetical protein
MGEPRDLSSWSTTVPARFLSPVSGASHRTSGLRAGEDGRVRRGHPPCSRPALRSYGITEYTGRRGGAPYCRRVRHGPVPARGDVIEGRRRERQGGLRGLGSGRGITRRASARGAVFISRPYHRNDRSSRRRNVPPDEQSSPRLTARRQGGDIEAASIPGIGCVVPARSGKSRLSTRSRSRSMRTRVRSATRPRPFIQAPTCCYTIVPMTTST